MKPTIIPKARCVRIVSLCGFLLFATFLSASAQSKDTLYFHNATLLVGELLNIKLGRVEFDADGVGVVKIKNKEIQSIFAQSNDFRIETTEGQMLQGYLRPSEKTGRVIVHSITDAQELELAGITSLARYGRTWKNGLSGNVSAGYSYTKSSEIGRLNLDGSVKYSAPKTETKLDVSTILTSDSTEVSREREDVSLSFNYTFKSLWSVGVGVRYQRNLELGLERRFQEGLGIGHRLLVRKNQQGLVLTGLAINQELNLEGVAVRNTEVILQANYELFSFDEPNLTISITQTGYFSVTEKGRIRYDGDANLSWELISDFYLNLQFYHNYDSQSPETGEPNVDYGFVVGITYKFD
jgi:hypothetical protein